MYASPITDACVVAALCLRNRSDTAKLTQVAPSPSLCSVNMHRKTTRIHFLLVPCCHSIVCLACIQQSLLSLIGYAASAAIDHIMCKTKQEVALLCLNAHVPHSMKGRSKSLWRLSR